MAYAHSFAFQKNEDLQINAEEHAQTLTYKPCTHLSFKNWKYLMKKALKS